MRQNLLKPPCNAKFLNCNGNNIVKLTEIYHVSADYLLLGIEKEIPASEPAKKELSHEYKKAIGIIAIIAATAIVTVLFITALGLLSRLGI